ncbi:MAG: septum formation initiator family protein [Lachnospirales bacterium]
MAKNKSEKKENKKSPAKLIYRISMSVMILIFVIAIFHQYLISLDLKKQEVALLAEISREEAVGLNLKNQKDNQDSPEFIEKIAREKLNMVGPKEIVFVDKNKKSKK